MRGPVLSITIEREKPKKPRGSGQRSRGINKGRAGRKNDARKGSKGHTPRASVLLVRPAPQIGVKD